MKFIIVYLFVALKDWISWYINATPTQEDKNRNKTNKIFYDESIADNNNGCSGDSTGVKSTMTDKHNHRSYDNIDYTSNNNQSKDYSHSHPTTPTFPSYNYYAYDQRVYNIYKLQEKVKKDESFSIIDAIKLLNWKYTIISLSLMLCAIVYVLCYLNADILGYFIFHKVFGYLFNNHFVVVRSDVPV